MFDIFDKRNKSKDYKFFILDFWFLNTLVEQISEIH